MAFQRERRHDGQLQEESEQIAAQPPPAQQPAAPQANAPDFASFDWSFQQYQSPPAASAAAAPVAASAPKHDPTRMGGGTYAARPGESLMQIATATYGHATFWEDIASANQGILLDHGPQLPNGGSLELPELATIDVMTRLEAVSQSALRDLAASMSDADYARFLDSLSDAERAQHERVIQVLELVRSTGMTMQELAHEQAEFIKDQIADGKSMQDQIDEHNAKRPQGKYPRYSETATDDDREQWLLDFPKVRDHVIETAPPEVTAVIEEAKSHGGGKVTYEPNYPDSTLAMSDAKWNMTVGPAWVIEGKADPTAVHSTFLHEMKGHSAYGWDRVLGAEILGGASTELSEADAELLSRNTKGISYAESEIIAELYEWSIDAPNTSSDHPFHEDPEGRDVHDPSGAIRSDDIRSQLELIQHAYAPSIGIGIVRALWRKIECDPSILPHARTLFRGDVHDVLGIKL